MNVAQLVALWAGLVAMTLAAACIAAIGIDAGDSLLAALGVVVFGSLAVVLLSISRNITTIERQRP